MIRNLALAVFFLALLAACAKPTEPPFVTELRARAWESKFSKDLPVGVSASKVEAYLRANGAMEINYTNDRKLLLAADSVELKRYFPPWPFRTSVQIQCSFASGKGLDKCLAVPSVQPCCSK
jgi:hypothetical protein